MNRTQILVISVFVLLVAVIAEHIYVNWGLITVHVKGQPLSAVIASIQRQGHAHVQTDLALDTPVTMDVDKVPLPDALETLSGLTGSRWRLLYFVAGDKATLQNAETSWSATGQRPDGWRMVSFPMGNMMAAGDDDGPPPDPRQDVWSIKTAAPAPVQDFLAEGAQATDAGFAFPEAWNPNVTSTPSAGPVAKVVPKLISYAGGKTDPVFFLSKPFRRQRAAEGDDNGATMRPLGDFPRIDPEIVAARAQAQINKLPADQRAEAQSLFDKFKAVRALPEDQRRAAMQQLMQDPLVQQQMANRLDSRDARMGHQQRVDRARNYVNRKLAAQGK